MTFEVVTLKLPRALLSEAQAIASARGISVGVMIRQFLQDEACAYHQPTDRSKERVISQLAPIFAAARDWANLNDALHRRGFTLRPMGTGLAIYSAETEKHLCNTATVGHRYRKLVNRFNCPMPGHPHGMKWVANSSATTVEFDVIDRDT